MPPLHSSISPVAFHTARSCGKGRKFSTDLWKTREAEGGFNEKRAEGWGKSARRVSFWAGFPYDGRLGHCGHEYRVEISEGRCEAIVRQDLLPEHKMQSPSIRWQPAEVWLSDRRCNTSPLCGSLQGLLLRNGNGSFSPGVSPG